MLLPRRDIVALSGLVRVSIACVALAAAIAGCGGAKAGVVAAVCEHAGAILAVWRARWHFWWSAVTTAAAMLGMSLLSIGRCCECFAVLQ